MIAFILLIFDYSYLNISMYLYLYVIWILLETFLLDWVIFIKLNMVMFKLIIYNQKVYIVKYHFKCIS